MDALLIEPGKHPLLIDIKNSLKILQERVGGHIEVVYPFEDPVGLVCNESGKLLGLPLNRALGDYDIIAGTFLIVGLDESDFCSLTPDLIEKYHQKFYLPEQFLRLGQDIVSIPFRAEENLSGPANKRKYEPER